MKQEDVFGKAEWVGSEENNFYILRRVFTLQGVSRAILRVLGLGFFHCYINGRRVGDAVFAPLNSEYEPRFSTPKKEEFSGFHTYVPEYDVTEYLQDGENVFTLHFGGGWYGVNGWYASGYGYDYVKAIWLLFGEDANGAFEMYSTRNDRIGKSFVTEYKFDHLPKETHDYRIKNVGATQRDFDDSGWVKVRYARPLQTEYLYSDCPLDTVTKYYTPVKTWDDGYCKVYDCGKNITGYPVLALHAKEGEEVRVVFSEALKADGTLDERYIHGQTFTVISDGEERITHPLFLWFGFRAFAVYGNAEPLRVDVVHANLHPTSSFRSDNELCNWIHDTYVHTQLMNMHTGTPTDCPHIERRGYTGDGQLTARASMQAFDGRAFYKKWIRDIADGQDIYTGKIHNTAPYVSAGGGPGGWGCAIVEIPYQYYCIYGDITLLQEYYDNMLRYFSYMERYSTDELVMGEPDDKMCLGEWCTPTQVLLPPPFVNTYFYIKSLQRAVEVARVIGRESDIALFEERISKKKNALRANYERNGTYCDGVQGANAFAVDIGLGDETTYAKLVQYYQDKQELDTGIFGTDVVTRVLFERGDGQLAMSLLLSNGQHSFSALKQAGATTLWEYMPNSLAERSLNHPMFGAIVAYFYEYLLGIQGNAGYQTIRIAPVIVNEINKLEGARTLADGTSICVAYQKERDTISFHIDIPENKQAVLQLNEKEYPLYGGQNRITVKITK